MDLLFPMAITLKDGQKASVRLLEEQDASKLFDMFSSLTARSRKFLYDDVTDFSIVEKWSQNRRYDTVLPLILEVEDEIVADGTLHRRPAGPLRHVGRIRVVVREDYKGRGIGTTITEILISCARSAGLKMVSCALAEEEEAAQATLHALGFERAARLPDYIMDPEGSVCPMVIMTKKLD